MGRERERRSRVTKRERVTIRRVFRKREAGRKEKVEWGGGEEIEAVECRERKTEMEEVRQVGGVPAGTIRDVNQWLIRVALSHGGREGRLRWIPLN